VLCTKPPESQIWSARHVLNAHPESVEYHTTSCALQAVSLYVETGGTDRETLCPSCLVNSSCVYCNELCLTKGTSNSKICAW
jgi:hypothetical protein